MKATITVDIDNQGRVVAGINGIRSAVDQLGQSADNTGRRIDTMIAVFGGNILANFFERGLAAAKNFAGQSVAELNKLRAATIGLQQEAIFRGFESSSLQEIVQNLAVVRAGLVSVGDASTSLKNLLQKGLSLDQAINLFNAFADSAAFGRQSSLGFGEAIRGATEGVKNNMSTMIDNAGVTKNVAVILREAGFQTSDLDSKTKGAAATNALYNGILKETASQTGNAARLTNTFQGSISRLDALETKLLQTVGELIEKNPEVAKGIDDIAKALIIFTEEASKPGTELNRTLTDFISLGGQALQIGGKLINFTREYADEISGLVKVASTLAGIFALTKGSALAAGLLSRSLGGATGVPNVADRAQQALSIDIRSRNLPDGSTLPIGKSADALREKFDNAGKATLDVNKHLAEMSRQSKEFLRNTNNLSERFKNFATGGTSSAFLQNAGLAAAIGGAIAEAVTGAIREASEKSLAAAEKAVNLGVGNKDLSQREAEFNRLIELRKSADLAGDSGGAFTDTKALNDRIKFTGDLINKQKELAEITKIIKDVESQRQAGKTLAEIDQKLTETTGFRSFDELREKALSLEKELVNLNATTARLAPTLREIAVPGAATSDNVVKMIQARQAAIEATGRILKEQLRSVDISGGNPYAALFADADKAQEDFLAKFGKLPQKVQDVLISIRERGNNLKLFQADLSVIERIASLRQQVSDVQNSRAFERAQEDRSSNLADRTAQIQRRINALSGIGDNLALELAQLADKFSGNAWIKISG